MNDKLEDLRKFYLGFAHIKKIKLNNLPKVSFFTSNLDAVGSLNGANSDDDNRHHYRAGC